MTQRKGPRLEGRNGMIWQRYLEGWSQARIAEEFELTQRRVSKIICDVREGIPEEEKLAVTTTVIARYDRVLVEAFDILNATHYQTTPAGKVVHDIVEYARDDDGSILLDAAGNPKAREVRKIEDPTPKIQALDRVLKAEAARVRLLGLEAPTRSEVSGPGGNPIAVELAEFSSLPEAARQERLAAVLEEVQRRADAVNGTQEEDAGGEQL